MTHTAKERVLWTIGILVVVLYALIPVAWIASLSFKAPEEIGDRKFFSGISWDNYDAVFSDDTFIAALVNSIGIASIATLISIVLAAMAAYATARLNFTGKALILIPLVLVFWMVLAFAAFALPIVGAIKANTGEYYKYPMVGVEPI